MHYKQLAKAIKLIAACIIAVPLQQGLAQCTIKGKIADSLNAPVPFVAVGLMKASDTTAVKGSLSSDSGAYVFTNVKQGRYIIKIQALGYADQYSSPIKADSGSTLRVPAIQLNNRGNKLNAVSVVVDKPFMERKADRMIFNVENSIVGTGKNALEMLNDLPGVSSNDNGNISVMGKSGVLIMVDDKPLMVDPATYLKSIDAGQIEKIEVITNPSAKYQASGKAIINIVLKRDKNLGLNGLAAATYKQGTYAGNADQLNLNYRTMKWNFFGNFTMNVFHNYGTHEVITNFAPTGTGWQEKLDENAPAIYQGILPYANLGVDFMPDKNQTISLSSELTGQPEKITTYANTGIYNYNPNSMGAGGAKSTPDSNVYTPSFEQLAIWDLNFNLDYKYKIDSTGRAFSANGFYVTHTNNDDQQLPSYYSNYDGTYTRPSTLSTGNEYSNMYFWLGQADYTQPLGKKAKLEMGVMETYFHTDNNFRFYNVVNGSSYADSTKSNRFVFSESVLAGYLNFSRSLGQKIDFQLGVRAEQTTNNGLQYVHDTAFNRNYINLFPSASVNWKLSPDNNLSISYTRRIDRPDYGSFNPFVRVLDPYNYTQGNIALVPQLSDNYELDYVFMQAISITIGHMYMNNVISNVFKQNDSTHITYSTPENLNTYSEYNIMLIGSIPVTNWWNTETSINVYNDHFIGTEEGIAFNRNQYAFLAKTLNTFAFKRGWGAELSFWYNSTTIDGLNTLQPFYSFDVGLGRHLFHEKLNIKATYSDIFRSQIAAISQVFSNVNILDRSNGDTRKFRLTLIWKFGKSQYHREENNTAKGLGNMKVGK